jgi:GT2 family glycosyltransferase
MNPRISVIVLTHNRMSEVLRTVERLLDLPEKPPVIVADNGSADSTVAALKRRFPEVRVVECGANLGAAGRNRAAMLATTDYLAFSDDDTRWEPGSLAEAVRVLDASPKVAVLSGKVLVGEARQLDATCMRMRASPLARGGLPGPSLIGYMAGACVFRAAVFRQVGGYEPRLFIGGEEELVALDVLNAGHAIVYCDTLVTTHDPSPSRDAALRRLMLARNAALVAWLRLPLTEALATTWRAFALFLRARNRRPQPSGAIAGRQRIVELAQDIGWAIGRRRVVDAHVIRMRRQVREAERREEHQAERRAERISDQPRPRSAYSRHAPHAPHATDRRQ